MDSKLAVKQLNLLDKMNQEKHILEMRLAAQWPRKYEMLIATILSAQTRDEVTIEVCEPLFKKYKNMKSLSNATYSDVRKIISKVNFAPTKARRIIETAKILAGKKIPETTEELIKLPGVGRKVANVYLAEALRADKIGVDTHVHRISFKLGWTDSRYPNTVEKDLESLFPKKYWTWINEICVRFGKTHGLSRANENKILSKSPFNVSKKRIEEWKKISG